MVLVENYKRQRYKEKKKEKRNMQELKQRGKDQSVLTKFHHHLSIEKSN